MYRYVVFYRMIQFVTQSVKLSLLPISTPSKLQNQIGWDALCMHIVQYLILVYYLFWTKWIVLQTYWETTLTPLQNQFRTLSQTFPKFLKINVPSWVSKGTKVILIYSPGIRKKIRAEKSSNRWKSRTFFWSNFFPPKFFWFIWNQMWYNNGRPLILKLVPNH